MYFSVIHNPISTHYMHNFTLFLKKCFHFFREMKSDIIFGFTLFKKWKWNLNASRSRCEIAKYFLRILEKRDSRRLLHPTSWTSLFSPWVVNENMIGRNKKLPLISWDTSWTILHIRFPFTLNQLKNSVTEESSVRSDNESLSCSFGCV